MSELNIPPFYVGQKVVALKSCSPIKKGKTYTVSCCVYANCCKRWLIGIKETPGDSDYSMCGFCGVTIHHTGHFLRVGDAKYFAPIQENFQSISLSQVIEKETELISSN